MIRTSRTLGGTPALHRDLLVDDLKRSPLPLKEVAIALDPLDEEVLDIGHHVGEGPADIVVLTHVVPGQARQRGAAYKSLTNAKPDLIPDPGMSVADGGRRRSAAYR